MKTMVLFVILVSLLVIAGCATSAPVPGSAAATATGTPAAVQAAAGSPLPMDRHVTLGSGNKTVDVSVESFEVGPKEETGIRIVTIYVAAHNTGTRPVMMVWYSRLTDQEGKPYGGIGISHDGDGARTNWILPNGTEAARDYVVVNSDRNLALLSKGAVLDVYFMDKPSEYANVSDVPDYHVAWTINPGTIS